MKEIEHIEIQLEIQPVDYKAAYAALARRASAAHAYEVSGKTFELRAELEAAMQVIERVETPTVFINPA